MTGRFPGAAQLPANSAFLLDVAYTNIQQMHWPLEEAGVIVWSATPADFFPRLNMQGPTES